MAKDFRETMYPISRPHPDRASREQEYEYAKVEALQAIAHYLDILTDHTAIIRDRLNEAALGGDR